MAGGCGRSRGADGRGRYGAACHFCIVRVALSLELRPLAFCPPAQAGHDVLPALSQESPPFSPQHNTTQHTLHTRAHMQARTNTRPSVSCLQHAAGGVRANVHAFSIAMHQRRAAILLGQRLLRPARPSAAAPPLPGNVRTGVPRAAATKPARRCDRLASELRGTPQRAGARPGNAVLVLRSAHTSRRERAGPLDPAAKGGACGCTGSITACGK